MTAHRVLVLLVFTSGCASARHEARSANVPGDASSNALLASAPVSARETGPVTHAPGAVGAQPPISRSAVPALDAKPLRHFYLLSPGPHATLVVTRSDLPTH
jgi:hypothetical protein